MFKSQDGASKMIVLGLSTAAVVAIGGFMVWRQKNRKPRPAQNPIPKKWRRVGEISTINLFPLKSGKHRSLQSAECTELGLREEKQTGKLALSDRSFVLFNEATKDKMTIRDYPKMLFIEIKAEDEDSVVFSSPGAPDLHVKLPNSNTDNKNNNLVKMFSNDKIPTVDCGDEASRWFTELLIPRGDVPCRLGYYPSDALPRRSMGNHSWVKEKKVYNRMDDEYLGVYSDLASYMIMTQASLDELNSRLDKPVNQYNFRPNFMVTGVEKPFEEDKWDWLKIGDDIVLCSFKPCTRCVLTTTDPETAVRRPDLEPLKTLRKYRLVEDPEIRKVEGQSPVMGIYMGLHRTGVIRLGDPVYVNCDQ